MLIAFLPEIRNKVEEQLVGEKPEDLLEAIHKLHGSCSYSGVPRLKSLCQLLEQQLRSGTPESELEPEFLELLDEMDNVTREARKCWDKKIRGYYIPFPTSNVAAIFLAVMRTFSAAFSNASSREQTV